MKRMRGARALRWIGAAALLGAAICVFITVRAKSEAEMRYPPRGQLAAFDGGRLHYLRSGSGSPVVLIHGNPGSVDDWDKVLPELARDHLVFAFDRPGHGHSDRGRASGSPKDQAAIFHEVLGALSVRRPILVGHSWGGT